jgi:hypothetical protein
MERGSSIRTQLLSENRPGKFWKKSTERLKLWDQIENSEKIFYWLNKPAIDWYVVNSLHPSISPDLGGLGVFFDTAPDRVTGVNIVTELHIRILVYLHRNNPDALQPYLKKIKKLNNRFRVVQKPIQRNIKSLYKVGPCEVNRREFKEFMYRIFGFVSVMTQSSSIEEVSYARCGNDVRRYILDMASLIEPNLSFLLDMEPTLKERFIPEGSADFGGIRKTQRKNPLTSGIPDSWEPVKLVALESNDLIKKWVKEDTRVLLISREDYKNYLKYQLNEESLLKKISACRMGAKDFFLDNLDKIDEQLEVVYNWDANFEDLDITAALLLGLEDGRCRNRFPEYAISGTRTSFTSQPTVYLPEKED